jgi:glutamine synthetase
MSLETFFGGWEGNKAGLRFYNSLIENENRQIIQRMGHGHGLAVQVQYFIEQVLRYQAAVVLFTVPSFVSICPSLSLSLCMHAAVLQLRDG